AFDELALALFDIEAYVQVAALASLVECRLQPEPRGAAQPLRASRHGHRNLGVRIALAAIKLLELAHVLLELDRGGEAALAKAYDAKPRVAPGMDLAGQLARQVVELLAGGGGVEADLAHLEQRALVDVELDLERVAGAVLPLPADAGLEEALLLIDAVDV